MSENAVFSFETNPLAVELGIKSRDTCVHKNAHANSCQRQCWKPADSQILLQRTILDHIFRTTAHSYSCTPAIAGSGRVNLRSNETSLYR